MPSRDLYSLIAVRTAIAPRVVASNALITGNVIDTQDFKSLAFILASGVLVDGTYTPVITVGDQPNLSDGVAAPASDLIGTIAAATFAATDDNVVKKIGYRGGRRYARLDLQPAGVTSGGPIGVSAILGDPTLA